MRGDEPGERRKQIRFYDTATGARVVHDEIGTFSREAQAEVLRALKDLARDRLFPRQIKHVKGSKLSYVRVTVDGNEFRVLFAPQGRFGHIILAVRAFSKKTEKIPPSELKLAEGRLADWQQRGRTR